MDAYGIYRSLGYKPTAKWAMHPIHLMTGTHSSTEDQNTSYDVWCTAEFNDFRDDQAGQNLLTPFPKSTILSIESSYYTAYVLVQVTKGPASIFCQAYPWALRPFTERPPIPAALQIQASPYTTNYMSTPSGRVLIEIEARSCGDGKTIGKTSVLRGVMEPSHVAGVLGSCTLRTAPRPQAPQKVTVIPMIGDHKPHHFFFGDVSSLVWFEELTPGRYYDVYCFSETYVPPAATGADTVAQFGMDAESILQTRTQLITLGPFFDDLGWSCVSGRPCNVTDLFLGDGV